MPKTPGRDWEKVEVGPNLEGLQVGDLTMTFSEDESAPDVKASTRPCAATGKRALVECASRAAPDTACKRLALDGGRKVKEEEKAMGPPSATGSSVKEEQAMGPPSAAGISVKEEQDMGPPSAADSSVKEEQAMGPPSAADSSVKEEQDMGPPSAADSSVKEEEQDMGLPSAAGSSVKEEEQAMGPPSAAGSSVKEEEQDMGLPSAADRSVKEEQDMGPPSAADSSVKEEQDMGPPSAAGSSVKAPASSATGKEGNADETQDISQVLRTSKRICGGLIICHVLTLSCRTETLGLQQCRNCCRHCDALRGCSLPREGNQKPRLLWRRAFL